MYPILLFFHSLFRWLVLTALISGIYRAWTGCLNARTFSKADNSIRHWVATIAHVQLMIGSVLYFTSPLMKYFFGHFRQEAGNMQISFFGIVHMLCMTTAIVIITIGSALSRRKQTDREKFRAMLIWFSVALVIILLAIPWPFSPFAARPFLRTI